MIYLFFFDTFCYLASYRYNSLPVFQLQIEKYFSIAISAPFA